MRLAGLGVESSNEAKVMQFEASPDIDAEAGHFTVLREGN